MKPRVNSKIEFSLSSKSETSQLTRMNYSNVTMKAIMIPSVTNRDFIEKELEDYEFDVLYDSDKAVWTSDLITGDYLINVKSPGHVETSQYIEIRNGRRHFNITCLQQNAFVTKVKIQAVNAVNGKPIKNVYVQVNKSSSQQNEEGITCKDGHFKFKVRNTCKIAL